MFRIEHTGMFYYPESEKTFKITIEELYANEILQLNDWRYISRNCVLTEQILEEFKDKFIWERVCWNETFSLYLLDKFVDYVDWDIISQYYGMPKEFMEKHKYYINWELAYDSDNVPENFSITF
jgi:hypothetical protein